MEEKVSIIIPIYNAEKYIKRCIDTIINQTYKNIEIIIINDGSTDNSINLINKYKNKDNRIIVINQKNAGVSVARNNGIKKSDGKYVMFVDIDDWIELTMVEEMVKIIKEQEVDIVRCNFFRNYEDNTQKKGYYYDKDIINKKMNKQQIRDEILLQILNGKMPGYMWLLIIKKEIFQKLKPLNNDLAMMEDTIFYIDLLFNIDTLYIYNKYLYHYYCNFDSASKSKNNYLRNLDNILLVNKIEEDILHKFDYDKIGFLELNTAHAKMIEDICYNLFKTNQKKDVMYYFNNIVNNDKVRLIMSKADLHRLVVNKRLSAKYIKEKNIEKLYTYYIYMNILSRLKTYLMRRKE